MLRSRKNRGKRLTEAILPAAVALVTLALAGPAVARRAPSVPNLIPASTTAVLFIALAFVVAAALVLGVVFFRQHAETSSGYDGSGAEARRAGAGAAASGGVRGQMRIARVLRAV